MDQADELPIRRHRIREERAIGASMPPNRGEIALPKGTKLFPCSAGRRRRPGRPGGFCLRACREVAQLEKLSAAQEVACSAICLGPLLPQFVWPRSRQRQLRRRAPSKRFKSRSATDRRIGMPLRSFSQVLALIPNVSCMHSAVSEGRSAAEFRHEGRIEVAEIVIAPTPPALHPMHRNRFLLIHRYAHRSHGCAVLPSPGFWAT